MSTNIDQPRVPDEQLLQEIANGLFKDQTVSSLPAIGQSLPVHELQQTASFGKTAYPGIPESHITNPGFPFSATGAGISPGQYNSVNGVDLTNQRNESPYPVKSSNGHIPSSVAGSGISPSAHHQNNEVDLKDPQTSLQDPHFPSEKQRSASVSGSGISPSARYLNATQNSNEEKGTYLQTDLKNILNSILSFDSRPQIPSLRNIGHDENFYFLKENHPAFASVKQDGQNLPQKSALYKPGFEVDLIKKDFPILQEKINGKPLVWLDNAATTQKPQLVIDRISYFYEHENSNIHRAAHDLAARATDAYESARQKVRRFINARSTNEIIFVRGTTEAINLVANTYGERFLQPGDEIILSHLEHHANIVPWQLLANRKGLKLRVIPVDEDGQVIISEYEKLLNPRTKLVSFTHVSNALGTITPAKQIIELAHHAGAKVLLDGAQSVSHIRVDMQLLNPDFFVFSGHKIFGPTGIGVFYGKEDLLNQLPPWQGGGNMIKDVRFEKTQFHDAPGKFEAGTGNIADAVGLGAALDYVNRLGIDLIGHYEHFLLSYATGLMKTVPGLKLIGTAAEKASVLSFTLEGFTNDEVGKALNQEGIAVRTGHHCAQPILRRFGLESTVRPSLAFYNTCYDVDQLVNVLLHLKGK